MKNILKEKLNILLILIVYALCFNPVAFAATSDFDTHTVTFSAKAGIEIDVVQATYGFGDVDPWGSPYTSANDVITANVKSNGNWTLKVKGDANFVSGGNTIPIARLAWSEDNGTPVWTTMTTSDATVKTGTPTGAGGVDVGMEYRLTIQYSDTIADNYSAVITYTGTTP